MRYLFIGLVSLCILAASLPALAQDPECRDPNPKEQELYTMLLQVFDQEIMPKCSILPWTGQIRQPDNTCKVVSSRSLPERPFVFCGFARLDVDMGLAAGSTAYIQHQDSLAYYQGRIDVLTKTIMDALSAGKTAAEVEQLTKAQAGNQKKLHDCKYAWARVSNQMGMTLRTEMNNPLLILSSPSSGTQATSFKRISIRGSALAYLVYYHDEDMADRYQVQIALGPWTDPGKPFHPDDEYYIPFHFQHHYLTDQIENLTFSITGGSEEDVLRLARSIDWEAVSRLIL